MAEENGKGRVIEGKEAEEWLKRHYEEKGLSRKRDWDRIYSGEITPEELQEENFGFPREAVRNAKIDWESPFRRDQES